MSKNWKLYLLWFAQENVEFRKAEIESLLSLFKIDMKFHVEPKSIEPYWIVEFASESDAKLLTNRSVSIRNSLELWAYDSSIKGLHEKLRNYPKVYSDQYFRADKSFKVTVETFNRHFTQKEKVDKLETFSYLPIQGDVNLKNPDVEYIYIEYYGLTANRPPELPYFAFFGRLIASGLRQLIKKISLKTRKFIGNTSMDAQLSLIMANQARIQNGDLVLDPFVGSGSLLVAAAEFGGYVLGTDIDYLMLHGRTKPTRIKQKERSKDESIKTNMVQYNLQHRYLDILVNDFAMKFWKDDLIFDAIVTDPPYGIRESTERIGSTQENCVIEEKHLSTHIPAKIEYGISNIYKDLLLFSAKHLKIGGRLVTWFPVYREDYIEENIPSHSCLKLVANCEQVLTKATARRLLTFEKIRDPNFEELNQNIEVVDFREKYFVVREETRKVRRTREAKIRELDRIKHLDLNGKT